MADYKVIMTLAIAGHSYDEIVAAAGCSRREVAAVKKTIAAYGFTAGQVGSMTPAEIAGLFPDGANELKDALASARDAITSATDRRSESRRRQEELIVTALARGSTNKDIAAAAGISRAWFYKADLAPNTPAVGRTPLPVTDEQQSTLNELVALRGEIEDLDDLVVTFRELFHRPRRPATPPTSSTSSSSRG